MKQIRPTVIDCLASTSKITAPYLQIFKIHEIQKNVKMNAAHFERDTKSRFCCYVIESGFFLFCSMRVMTLAPQWRHFKMEVSCRCLYCAWKFTLEILRIFLRNYEYVGIVCMFTMFFKAPLWRIIIRTTVM